MNMTPTNSWVKFMQKIDEEFHEFRVGDCMGGHIYLSGGRIPKGITVVTPGFPPCWVRTCRYCCNDESRDSFR